MREGRAMNRSSMVALLCVFSLALAGSAAAAAVTSDEVTAAVPAATGAVTAAIVPAAAVGIDLSACQGAITLPDATVVDVWGFQVGATCSTPQGLPGPELRVTEGDTLTITLHNYLDVPTSILIPGQEVTATGASGVFTNEAAAGGGTATYVVANAVEGTFLYESGTNPSIQVPMGLYGAMIVDPTAPGQAYDDPSTAYDSEAVLVLSEIDPDLNANPAGFDLLDYHPTYWLINGEAYPDTDRIGTDTDDSLLVRYVNAGFENLSMEVLGAYQRVVAKQGFALNNAFDAVAEIIPAGSTADMIIDTSGLTAPAPLFNRNEYLTNGNQFPGGMLTFVEPAAGQPDISIVSPSAFDIVFGDVDIEIDAFDDGPAPLTVEWSEDGGASWLPAGPGSTTTHMATWATDSSDDGSRTILARATDGDGNTATDAVTVTVANAPMVSFTPPASAQVYGDAYPLIVNATDTSDAASDLTVDWEIDGGVLSGTATWDPGDSRHEADLDTTLLSDGPHTLSVTATDTDLVPNSTTVDHLVFVSNQPVAAITSPVDGANVLGLVTLSVQANDLEDDTVNGLGSLVVSWDVPTVSQTYNAGADRYEAVWDSSTSSGSPTLTVTVTDGRGNTATDSVTVNVQTGNQVHIADLDGSATGGTTWTARAKVTVHSATHTVVKDADVSFDVTRYPKSGGTLVTSVHCITTGSGSCTASLSGISVNDYENAVLFQITNVTSSAPYVPSSNHDPDGNDPISITVEHP